MRETFGSAPPQEESGTARESEVKATPSPDTGAGGVVASSPDALEEARRVEHQERVRAIAEARAAIEARRAGTALSDEAREEVLDLRADLEEIAEIDEAIRTNIATGGLDPEGVRRENERLQALAGEREAIEKRIADIKSGSPEGRQPSTIVRKVGIGGERPQPAPVKPWWKRMLGL